MFGNCGDGHGGNPTYSMNLSESPSIVSGKRTDGRYTDDVLTNNFVILQCDD
jgi:hypothetical protein